MQKSPRATLSLAAGEVDRQEQEIKALDPTFIDLERQLLVQLGYHRSKTLYGQLQKLLGDSGSLVQLKNALEVLASCPQVVWLERAQHAAAEDEEVVRRERGLALMLLVEERVRDWQQPPSVGQPQRVAKAGRECA